MNRIVTVLVGVVVLGFAIWWLVPRWGSSSEASGKGDTSAPSPKTVSPTRKTLKRIIEIPAETVEAFRQAPLYARVAGYVKTLDADIGDRVKMGQTLLTLEAPELLAELAQREAMIAKADAELLQAEEAIASAKAGQKSAESGVKQAVAGKARAEADDSRAASQLRRLSKVGKSGAIDADALDEVRYSAAAAKATLGEIEALVVAKEAICEECKAKCRQAAADQVAALARKKVAQAERDKAKAMVDYLKIVAPFDGIITRRRVDVGHFVQPADSSGRGMPLFTIEQSDRVRILLPIPERDTAIMRFGPNAENAPTVQLRAEGLGGRMLTAKLTRTSHSLDPRTRTMRVEIEVANPEDVLRPGMFVQARVEVERKEVWTLPSQAIVKEEAEAWVMLMEGGKSRKVAVGLGMQQGEVMEVQSVGGKEVTGKEEIEVK
jgi:RND family efflux transporter MFP subunit